MIKKNAFIYFSDSYEAGYKKASVALVDFYLFEEGEVTKNLKRAKKFLEESIKNKFKEWSLKQSLIRPKVKGHR